MEYMPSKKQDFETGVDIEALTKIGLQSVNHEGITPHDRIQKYHIQNRVKKIEQNQGLDWATCEALAFGSLLTENYHVRISGQDVGRGTFSQRHAMLVDHETERTIIPLNNLSKKYKLEIANSHLSEYAVLGFEYGISWETPKRLCIWEAQFGDFFNGAQIVIDVYLSSGEQKWMRQSGLVMLLPHGYDGAGPEHSSCRVERFLQLCDEGYDGETKENPNMHVVNPTTPAQYFHVLRRQMLRNYRKPLIVMGPKGLLRAPHCSSLLAEMGPGTSFLPVLADQIQDDSKVEMVCFLSGKLYYDLVKERNDRKLNDRIAFIRVEEINPFPKKQLLEQIQKFKNVKGIGLVNLGYYWLQEEPQNQGCYTFIHPRLEKVLGKKLEYHGRKASAAPATGISKVYKKEQEYVVKGLFDLL
jgi:probable 2-oxoglutarate dehydrogenase E1 component DHKTD1